MNKKLQVFKYLFFDTLSATTAWFLFYLFRKLFIEPEKYGKFVPIEFDKKFWLGLIIIPLFWLLIYYLTGIYKHIYRKSRLKELGQTFITSVIGVLILFFTILLDDEIFSYKNYYQSILVLFGLHFILTSSFRFILSSITNYKMHNRIIGFNTLLVGSN